MKILITGIAGFIGMHLGKYLSKKGFEVVGIDNINSYYDTELKYARLNELGVLRQDILYNKKVNGNNGLVFTELNLLDAGNLTTLFAKEKFEVVIHLAAQAGVRYSITNPNDYIESNIIGFFNIIEACRSFPVKHFIFASSSSVYGNSNKVPFSIDQKTDEPVSLYAATKKSNELIAHTYSNLYKIPSTGLRFFTVYGPWGRPDMAYFNFTRDILSNKEISLYNGGDLKRDFTYIDDVVECINRLINMPPATMPFYRILNIGNQDPVQVSEFLKIIERKTGKKAIIKNLPMQPGDVNMTFSDSSEIEKLTGFLPNTPIEKGLDVFISWFQEFYSLK
jgi:UDP-glucuronate 4-epimerase